MKNKIFKKVVTGILILALMLSFVPSIKINAADDQIPVSFSSPAIPVNSGEAVDLTNYYVQLTSGGEFISDIAWSSSDLTISNNSVTAPAPGVYKLTAKSGELSKTVYLVAKAPDATEYVLYENSFASTDGLTAARVTSASSWSASDGKLTLDASASTSDYVTITMPEWLADFTDCRISVNATMQKAYNEKRYISMLYRFKDTENYYQMAIRQNATLTNGVEIAQRASKWNVTHTASYSEKLSTSKEYTFVTELKGNSAAIFINGSPMAFSDSVTTPANGRIGLQVNGCKAVFSSYKVTLMTDDIRFTTETSYTQVKDADTGITLAPSIVTYGTSDYSKVISDGASAAIYEVGASLAVKSGGTVSDVITGLDKKVIPIFKVSNETDAKAVASELSKLKFNDVFIMSDNADAVLAARNANKSLMGALDLSGKTEIDLSEARESANKSKCRVVLLPASLATRKNVEALQEMFTTVWVVGGDTPSAHAASVTTGANGIVTSDVEGILKFMKNNFSENSVVRTVQIIAHRGVPPLYQENSIAGSIHAYELGATMIENDVHMTSDGVVVVMHDETIDRTTNGTGKIESMTYAELSKYVLDGDTSLPTQPIPTLEDYFKEFKGKDVKIVIEIKTKNTSIIPKLVELVEKYDILDQVNFITFDQNQIFILSRYLPEAPCGYLCSSMTFIDKDSTYSAEKILKEVQPHGTTFNPNYKKGLGNNTMKALNYRGITVWPYTVNTKSDFDTMFLAGLSGLTTNYTDWMTDITKTVSAPSELTFKIGDDSPFEISALTYGRKTSTVSQAEMILVEGNGTLKYESGKLTATEAGTATVMFRVKATLPNGTEFYLYTEPTSVTVISDEPVETPSETQEQTPSETPNETPNETPDETDKNNTETPAPPAASGGCSCANASAAALSIITAIATYFIFKRRF